MIELKPIRVLRAVSDQKSFSLAARELGIAPASATRIIAQLEKDLGTQLLVRTTRQVSLTSAGATVLAQYRPLLEGFEEVTRNLQRANQPDKGHLRLTAPVSLGVTLLPQVISGFRLVYPNISVEINFTDTLLDVIEENCDLAVRVSGPPTDKSTIWRKLCEVPRHMIAAPSLFDRIPRPDHPRDLNPDFLMSYSAQGRSETWEFSHAGSNVSIQAGGKVISNNGDFLYALAVAGDGICVLPDFITYKGLASGQVEQVMPNWSITSLWLTLYYPPYEQLPPIVGTFAEYFEAFVQSHPNLETTA
ncbi:MULTISPECIES: LysR family transcriptional regulator [unclassified Ruegeria]|uniref:LysR family transcriptional regulator n=1 Tax=unclassified Ruegeria TaxID=2625375 RepID=UPI001489795A|nr:MULTISPECIES: LysR family transcriptional regulator [unclassified Ruegeria]NOD74935.1 LysR family transcriptional regulator [Ruegeria sp. HKCCD4332]NOD86896.1 LysR family transcriptional regulator [Ruegeria sp. HKCCD4318]NOE12451.1 LysR family transcriptional regulator [Ruegeria sp. HKCCD4318-2]NOG09384.1 LysR family transcriptional regulator [Ruegeria sp. HKCCD4315]